MLEICFDTPKNVILAVINSTFPSVYTKANFLEANKIVGKNVMLSKKQNSASAMQTVVAQRRCVGERENILVIESVQVSGLGGVGVEDIPSHEVQELVGSVKSYKIVLQKNHSILQNYFDFQYHYWYSNHFCFLKKIEIH